MFLAEKTSSARTCGGRESGSSKGTLMEKAISLNPRGEGRENPEVREAGPAPTWAALSLAAR